VEKIHGIEHCDPNQKTYRHLWLQRDYVSSLERIIEDKEDMSMRTVSLKYGEIEIPDYGSPNTKYIYSDRFGLKKEKGN